MKKYSLISFLCLLMATATAWAVEPQMSDYTAMPIFTNTSVPPNVMIILDNSGSMNFNAYGAYPGDRKTVTGSPYSGEPYSGMKSFAVESGQDDLEQFLPPSDPVNNGDLDFGNFNGSAASPSLVAIRFQHVAIPKGAVIQKAYIEFVARTNTNPSSADHNPANILIEGVASDDAPVLQSTTDFIDQLDENYGVTTATTAWDNVEDWISGETYQTKDVSAIIQEIIDRAGWQPGNAVAFRFSGSGFREAYSYDYNSGSVAPVLRVYYGDPDATRYYGLFNPDYFYQYTSNVFYAKYKKIGYDFNNMRWNVETLGGTATTLNDATIVSEKLWDGNWANWLSMRRIDILRKVLMGGKATSRTGGGNQHNLGEVPDQTNRIFYKRMDTRGEGPAVSPYDGNYTYRMENGRIYLGDTNINFALDIKRDITFEPEQFKDGNLAGVLQRIGDKARWGNIWFNDGSGHGESGGTVAATIGTNITTLITDLQNTGCDTWTPLAESFYVAMQYFAQRDPAGGLDYPTSAVPHSNDVQDPYYDKDAQIFIPCAKSFVILLTDGASTKDANIPSQFKDFDGDGDLTGCSESNSIEYDCDYPSDGTDFLDDLALYARTTDLRPDGEADGLEGMQNIMLYTIYAFGNDPNARDLLKDAARNGGFDDRNKNGLPDGDYNSPAEDRLEWDEDGDNIPDTYFEASDGYAMESKLLEAITDILKRASSGTAASVLATNTVGAGNSVQAYFRPIVQEGLEEARWMGYLETLWVDPWGNLRENNYDKETNKYKLDLKNSSDQNEAGNVDRIVEFVNAGDDTVARRYLSHYLYNPANGDSGTCKLSASDCELKDGDWEDVSMDLILPLFDAGKRLSERDPDGEGTERQIFTYIGPRNDKNTDYTRDTSGNVIVFDTGMAVELTPYLGVTADSRWKDYGSDVTTRVNNLIEYVRGKDSAELTGKPGTRNRTLNGVTWRLGDIVHSTPIVVARPSEQFHQLYNDRSYAEFLAAYKDRETMIYVGANDGMLHAFTNWQYEEDDEGNPMYTKPSAAGTGEQIGDELWAYIPQSVLPHLKWLGLTDYTHTYFVDGEPRVFDANILPNNTHYSSTLGNYNFGTFLVMGMGMGGKDIDLNADIDGDGTNDTMSPTYILLDITEPRNPRLMWERSYENLGMSYSVPAPVRVNGKWFLVFGSGPTEYDATSANGGYIYVVDMLTGEPYGSGNDWRWGELINNGDSYFNDPLALDIFQSANADAIYLANNYYGGGQWASDIYKIAVPCTSGHCPWDGVSDDEIAYDSDPANWQLSKFFESDRPVSVKLASSTDPVRNVLLYFGTGRYISEDDKTDSTQQYMYGIKDPFYNRNLYETSYYHSFGSALTLTRSDLFQSDGVEVTTDGYVSFPSGTDQSFGQFLEDMRLNKNGWYLSLLTSASGPSERIITRPAILGGIVLTPTYTPNTDVCEMGGDTQLLGVYYETGTGYTSQVFDIENIRHTTITIDNGDGTSSSSTQEVVEIRDDNLMKGTPAPKIVFHVGLEEGATSKLQMSTRGEGGGFTDPALNFRNAITEWWDNE